MFVYELSGCGFESSCSHNAVSLANFSDEDVQNLNEYYLHNKERIRQCTKITIMRRKQELKKQEDSLNNPQESVEKILHLIERGQHLFVLFATDIFIQELP